MEFNNQVISWLLQGDPAIQYQVYRDLLGIERPDIQQSIEYAGWGAQFLAQQNPSGHWGRGFYQPKWISSHYILLDLKHLNISKDCIPVHQTLKLVVTHEKGHDGGINPSGSINNSDVCINGMALNYLSYFRVPQEDLHSVIDFIVSQQLPDGGFNCRWNRSGARHSSMHSTLSVLEGLQEYLANQYCYREEELKRMAGESREFLLAHKLYQSHRTGEIMDKKMMTLSYPPRWYYDILKSLEYFRSAHIGYDERMHEALTIILKKRRTDGTWNLQGKHPGQTHFEMEKPGKPSRWNTLRALRVLKHFQWDESKGASLQ